MKVEYIFINIAHKGIRIRPADFQFWSKIFAMEIIIAFTRCENW